MKTGCGVRCATVLGGESAVARSSNAVAPRLVRDPHDAAKSPLRIVMGASIAEPRSDEHIGKSRRGLMPGCSDLRADRQALADEPSAWRMRLIHRSGQNTNNFSNIEKAPEA